MDGTTVMIVGVVLVAILAVVLGKAATAPKRGEGPSIAPPPEPSPRPPRTLPIATANLRGNEPEPSAQPAQTGPTPIVNQRSNVVVVTVERTPATSQAPKSAEPDISLWEMPAPKDVSAKFTFDYRDAAGARTTRTVQVQRFGQSNGQTYIFGHCELAQAWRTFRADRIIDCVDEATGEFVDATQRLEAIYEASPERAKDALREAEYDVLRILLYVGKADGRLMAAEKRVIREVCVALTGDDRLTDAMIDRLLSELDVPTLQAFRMAVGRLLKRGEEAANQILNAARRIVQTQKTVHPAEQEAIDYIQDRMAKDLKQAPKA